MVHEIGTIVEVEELEDFCVRAFQAVGVPQEDARITADCLILSELREEVASHGVRLVPVWCRRIQAGSIKAVMRPTTVREGCSTALLEGGFGIGAVAGHHAMHLAITKAKDTGIGLVGVRNSTSPTGIKYYPMIAIEHHMIGFTATNGISILPPTGGLTAKVNTTPIAISVPAKTVFPIVLDMALAATAYERLRMAAEAGGKIPLGWGVDKFGNPTDDPKAVLSRKLSISGVDDKAMLDAGIPLGGGFPSHIGGYKGYGLAVMVDMLTGVLLGGAFMDDIKAWGDDSEPERVSFILGAINIENFIPYDEFIKRVDTYVRKMKDCKLMPGVKEIYLPGEQGMRREQGRRKTGIPLSRSTVEVLREMARNLSISGIPNKI